MAHATHVNAALTPRADSVLVGWSLTTGGPQHALPSAMTSRGAPQKWAERYRDEGPAGMFDPSSAPHRHPNGTLVRKIVHLRWK